MSVLGFGLALVLTLAIGLLLLSRAIQRVRRVAAASISALYESPLAALIPTSDADVVVCSRRLVELLGLETPDGFYADHDGLPMSFSIGANPRLAPLCVGLDISGTVLTADGEGRQVRLRRRVHQQQLEDGPATVFTFDELAYEPGSVDLEPTATGFSDELTGLASWALFQDRANQAIEAAVRDNAGVAVIVLEIDQFDHVLAEGGVGEAGRLIREVGTRIGSTGRAMDTIARVDRNRFAILLPRVDSAAVAALVAQRFVQMASFALEGPADARVEISASAGIALSERRGTTALRILERAARTCANARAAGGNRALIYTPARDGQASADSTSLAQELRNALSDGQFYLEYQPIISLATHRPIAFEALARWRHPQRGIVPPSEFIGEAERSGFILELGAFILNRACSDASAWPYDIKLFVNASAVQLLSSEFPGQVLRALAKTELAPDRLVLEMTESSAVSSVQRLIVAAEQLRALGVGVVLDDFGTGQSSLSHLRAFSVDGLKIDRQFITDIASPASREVVKMLVYYCRHRGLLLIAEGVETKEQEDIVRELGCVNVQGYRYGRPLSAAAASEMSSAGLLAF